MTVEESGRSVTVRLPARRSLSAGLAVLVVAALVAAVVLAAFRVHDLSGDKARLQDRLAASTGSGGAGLTSLQRSAITAAAGYATAFATYGYRTLDADFAATEAHSVDPFLSQYRQETAQIRPSLVKLKSQSTGKVISAGIVSASPTSAVVDLFLDQTISNSASKQPRVDAQRVEMTLARRDGKWLISKVVLP